MTVSEVDLGLQYCNIDHAKYEQNRSKRFVEKRQQEDEVIYIPRPYGKMLIGT